MSIPSTQNTTATPQAVQLDPTRKQEAKLPSKAVAIIAGIVGIVALPIIAAVATVITAIALPPKALYLAYVARFSSDTQSAANAKSTLSQIPKLLRYLAISLIPGFSLVASVAYLQISTPNPDGSRRLLNEQEFDPPDAFEIDVNMDVSGMTQEQIDDMERRRDLGLSARA